MPRKIAGKIYDSNQEVYNQLGLYTGADQAGIKGKLQTQQINALKKDLIKPVNNNVSIKSIKKQINKKPKSKSNKNLNSAHAYYSYKQKVLNKNQFIKILKIFILDNIMSDSILEKLNNFSKQKKAILKFNKKIAPNLINDLDITPDQKMLLLEKITNKKLIPETSIIQEIQNQQAIEDASKPFKKY